MSFKLKIEAASTIEMRYLDIVLKRHDNRILTFPFLKDPCLSRRLSCKSAHPRDVHVSWPEMMLKRVNTLTSSGDAVCEYTDELLKRLREDGCFLPTTKSARDGVVSKRFSSSLNLWLPLGYHPWWYRQVKRALARMNNDVGLNTLLKMAVKWNLPTVHVTWKNMLPSTDNLLRH